MQQDQLRDRPHNPQVIETLTAADLDDAPAWITSELASHLHKDQVLATYSDDDLWRKGWGNKIWAEKIIMSFPSDASRSPDPLVQECQRRMHGHAKEPLTSDEKRRLRSRLEQKTDREKRALDGDYAELLLSQVVKSEERSTGDDEDSGSLIPWR